MTDSTPRTYPVAIVGGGPVGLASSILLSLCKIPHKLFERYPSTSIHPKACGYNHRTVEIFRLLGIEKDVIEQRAPKALDGHTAWYTSFGPNGRQIVQRDAWGGGEYADEYATVSPCAYSILPQIRLEPILKKRALELNPEGIFYNAEVVEVEEAEKFVSITVRSSDGGETVYRAGYCIAADGGRGLTDSLGIGWEGERDIIDMVSAHVRAPLSSHHPDTRNFITWFVNPRLGGSIGTGYLYHLGPYPMKPETEEWLFACALNPSDPKRFDESAMQMRLLDTLQIPNLNVELISTSHWYVNALCAKRYRSKFGTGRVFLAGDAAHRIPPWGALGLNTGIQDVHNLVWKLNLAIKGKVYDSQGFNHLLDTYDTERRPIGQRVRDTSLHNLRSHALVMDTALGLSPTNTTEENVKAMDSFFDKTDTGEGEARRKAVDKAQKILDGEFHALGAEIGWFYPDININGDDSGEATRHGGQLNEDGVLETINYHPSTIPGYHLPHLWLEREQTEGPETNNGCKTTRISTRDLVRYDGFVLLTSQPELWQAALATEGGLDIGGLVHVVGISSGPSHEEIKKSSQDKIMSDAHSTDVWNDLDGKWPSLSGLQPSGAVLVRPDGIVAWRTLEFDEGKHGAPGFLRKVVLRSLLLDGADTPGEE
ncbi:hypothetical protein LTR84_012975 [Exophiala bonariae]|uniref:FAD-binding domain-containing protein n=1 Tax=Exophiala bonariae TaxID=1690606 RepID=A0AAV9NG14_9EURO|nr:hypothetical protein LTR84_012975 [Exophiala bonariae]